MPDAYEQGRAAYARDRANPHRRSHPFADADDPEDWFPVPNDLSEADRAEYSRGYRAAYFEDP